MDALLIRSPWIDKILDGSKTCEVRGTRTTKRGQIGLIESGTGMIVGVANLVGVVGPISLAELVANSTSVGLTKSQAEGGLPYHRTFAWVMDRPRRLKRAVRYHHPPGAVIWVKLGSAVRHSVLQQLAIEEDRQ